MKLAGVIALLAPGQGAQTPGMLAPWLVDDASRAAVARWSAATGLDLERLGTTAHAEEIKDTAVTQPLVVATALLAHGLLAARVELPVSLVSERMVLAGHSVGELAAAMEALRQGRVVLLLGEAGSGKTLLAEALLTESGAIRSRGSLERGTTVWTAGSFAMRSTRSTAESSSESENVSFVKRLLSSSFTSIPIRSSISR